MLNRALISLIALALAGGALAQTASQPEVVNVTSDSQRGWLPSAEQKQAVQATTVAYLAAKDGGRAEEAYAFFHQLNRRGDTPEAHARRLKTFNDDAGAVRERRIAKVTWTKDPASAPAPGVYAAIDVVSRFERMERNCGYVVLYQGSQGGSFKVMRDESTSMSNAVAAQILAGKGAAEVDRVWAAAATFCPNYRPPLTETSSSIGYASPAAALAALKAKPGVQIRDQDGWTIAVDEADFSIWSFTPPGHPAYPAAVRRHVVSRQGGSTMEMSILCQASKEVCDDLVRSFQNLNARTLGN